MSGPIFIALSLVCGHELPDGVVQRGVRVTLRRDRLDIQYQVGLSPATARRQLRSWGVPLATDEPVFPAYRAAGAAIAGDLDRAHREYDLFLREYLKSCLSRHRGNVTKAAEEAGLVRSSFHKMMKKHGLSKP